MRAVSVDSDGGVYLFDEQVSPFLVDERFHFFEEVLEGQVRARGHCQSHRRGRRPLRFGTPTNGRSPHLPSQPIRAHKDVNPEHALELKDELNELLDAKKQDDGLDDIRAMA